MVDDIFGTKPYQIAGRRVLPILIRQAEAACTIFYENLAREIGMPNERNLNYPLGSIGVTLEAIAAEWEIEVPHIQSIVISQKTGHPGSGFDGFLAEKGFENLSSTQKKSLLREYYAGIFNYPYWNDVLEYCELERVKPNIPKIIAKAGWQGGGEGPEHSKLKELIRTNPNLVGLPATHPHGDPEYRLPSGDSVDILFGTKRQLLAVEVKSSLSDVSDIARGLFQCIKYSAVLESLLKFEQIDQRIKVCLALGGDLPETLVPLRNSLGISVYENIRS